MQDTDKDILCSIALTRIPRLGVQHQRQLVDAMGSAAAVYDHHADIRDAVPEASEALAQLVKRMDEYIPYAEAELQWARSKQVQSLTLQDAAYPARMRECPDAPLVLYYRGTADLNALHIINMVGTRQCTDYGRDLCRRFVAELAELCPDCVVVSGLAYGIDINAHRNALQNGLPTVGVLAHGLDQIYPRMHQATATEMLSQGGLLTEYMRGTPIDKVNFLARNRIVAGMSQATVVVESAARGGSLATARIAGEYARDVFAFPGRVGDEASAGCNTLIRRQQAQLLTSAQELVEALGWDVSKKPSAQAAIQRELFVDLTPDQQRIADALKGSDGKAVNRLAVDTGLAISQLTAALLGMEMHGVVRMVSGGMYKLV